MDHKQYLPEELKEKLEGLLPGAKLVKTREYRAELERELRELQAAVHPAPPAPPAHPDQNLVSEVEALSMGASPAAVPPLRALADALAHPQHPHPHPHPHPHHAFLHEYLCLLPRLSAPDAYRLSDEITRSVSAALQAEGAALEGWCAAAAWLAACAWPRPRPRPHHARALLHRALRPASRAQVEELARVLAAAAASELELLELSDAVRGDAAGRAGRAGGAGGAEALGALLLRAALARLLRRDVRWAAGPLRADELQEMLETQFGKLAANEQLLAVRLVGRALAAPAPGALAPSAPAADAPAPDAPSAPAPDAPAADAPSAPAPDAPARLVRALSASASHDRQVQVALKKLELLFIE